tara:strand:+ start:215 stop:334 length:120 start_codon:yes stop_codon:yes gene_type:complete
MEIKVIVWNLKIVRYPKSNVKSKKAKQIGHIPHFIRNFI